MIKRPASGVNYAALAGSAPPPAPSRLAAPKLPGQLDLLTDGLLTNGETTDGHHGVAS